MEAIMLVLTLGGLFLYGTSGRPPIAGGPK